MATASIISVVMLSISCSTVDCNSTFQEGLPQVQLRTVLVPDEVPITILVPVLSEMLNIATDTQGMCVRTCVHVRK